MWRWQLAYTQRTFVPPTPGPIAAAGNLGLESNLGLVIGVGVFVAAVAALAGMLWANRFQHVEPDGIEVADEIQHDWQALKASYGKLPTASQAFAPIFVPILLICLALSRNSQAYRWAKVLCLMF